MLNRMITDKAKQLYEQESDFWSAELIGELENRQRGLAFSWAKSCFAAFWSQYSVEAPCDYEAQLRELDNEVQCVDDLMKTAEALEQNRDDTVSLAFAHLFMSKFCFLRHDNHYRKHLIYAMGLLGNQGFFRQSSIDFLLQLALELLERKDRV